MIAPLACGTVVATLGLFIGLRLSGRLGPKQFGPLELDVAQRASVRVAQMSGEEARRRHASATGTYNMDLNQLTCTCAEAQARMSFPEGDIRRACKHITRVAGEHFGQAPNDIGWLYVCPPSSVPSWASESIAFDDIHVTEHADLLVAVGSAEHVDLLDVVVQDGHGALTRAHYSKDGTCISAQKPAAHRDIVEALWLSGFVTLPN